MFTIPQRLSHLRWPEFGAMVCYLFDPGDLPNNNCKIYAICPDHNGNTGENCIVSSAPIKVWHNDNSIDFWFRHTLIQGDYMIVSDYSGLTVWDRTLNPIFSQPVTQEMKMENGVYGYMYKDGTLSYWPIIGYARGEYHDPLVAPDGQLYAVDLGIDR